MAIDKLNFFLKEKKNFLQVSLCYILNSYVTVIHGGRPASSPVCYRPCVISLCELSDSRDINACYPCDITKDKTHPEEYYVWKGGVPGLGPLDGN